MSECPRLSILGLVAGALKDASVAGSEPLAGVPMLATGLPVEDDLAGEAAVNPEVAVGTTAGDGSVEIADEGFVRPNVTTREHALFHTSGQQAALVGDFCGGIAHGVGAEVHAVTLEVGDALDDSATELEFDEQTDGFGPAVRGFKVELKECRWLFGFGRFVLAWPRQFMIV